MSLRNRLRRSFVNAPVEHAITKLKVARSLPNDQNGLLDHLALNSSKSSLCQLQLCINGPLSKAKNLGRQIAMHTPWNSFCMLQSPPRIIQIQLGCRRECSSDRPRTEIKHCKNIWNYCGFLKNFGLLMHVDALSYRIVDFSLVFILFAARRKTIMQEFSPVQKCLLFLVFLNISGRDSA